MKKGNVFFIFLALSINVYAAKTSITFTASQSCEINLYEPIENTNNNMYPTHIIKLAANKSVNHEIEVDKFAFIKCEIPTKGKFALLLFPNDSVDVHIDNTITFQGSNRTGLQYLNDKLSKSGDLYMIPMEQLILKYIERKIDLKTALHQINQTVLTPILNGIDQSLPKSTTSEMFTNTLKKDIQIETNSYLILLLRSSLAVDSYKATALQDSVCITKSMDSIFKTTVPFTKESLKYRTYNYFAQYQIFYYGENSPQSSDTEFLGSFSQALYAPVDMQPIFIGIGCLLQLNRRQGNMDLPLTQKFLVERFPDNQYTAIVTNKMETELNTSKKKIPVVYVTEKTDSLSQLKNVPTLSGKYLFIDLWASWCMPCRKEFSYRKQLEELLSSYGNVSLVYISIDDKRQEGAWKQCIQNYELSGTHLLASNSLKEYIQKQIFGLEEFTIPRYLFISPDGKILNRDLPRPSEYPKLKETLDHIIQ